MPAQPLPSNNMPKPQSFDQVWAIGEVGMVNGAAQIPNTGVTANTVCILSHHQNQAGTFGHLSYSLLPGVGIDVLSDSLVDNSIVAYMLAERTS
jgi:hypothetical protein